MIISIKYLKLITTYSMLYDTCDYHILHYSKLIIVHPITTVRIVNLTSKRMNNSCALLCQNSTPYDQSTLNGTYHISATGWNILIKI